MGRTLVQVGKHAVLAVLRGIWLSTIVILPLFGMWLASSLAAYHNATQWLSLLVGLLLFPIVPVGWDLVFAWRVRKQPARKPILTRVDRLVLRTLIVNLIFVVGLVWQKPVAVYQALSVRGDWMLDGHDGPTAGWVRTRLFTIADWFQRGWTPSSGAHYGKSDEAPSQPPPPPPPPPPPALVEEPPPAGDGELPDGVWVPPDPPRDPSVWPMPATIDPIVAAATADPNATIASIGAYLAANVPDERQRVKAVHDVVVTWLTYDYEALKQIKAARWASVPSMKAEDVFARRSAVCEGYARLMVAMGAAANVEIAYVSGVARGLRDRRAATEPDTDDEDFIRLAGDPHAWNAAKVNGSWYPLDATWDDGEDQYTTTYLLTPPDVFIRDHFPDVAAWQLLSTRISAAEFLRQAGTSPLFSELGLELTSPTRSQVSVSGAITVEISNPRRRDVMATIESADGGKSRNCGYDDNARTLRLRCGSIADGEWRVDLWASPHGARTLAYVGSIWVNSR
jgi:hypothetical protein